MNNTKTPSFTPNNVKLGVFVLFKIVDYKLYRKAGVFNNRIIILPALE